MVERSLRMREVRGSMPLASIKILLFSYNVGDYEQPRPGATLMYAAGGGIIDIGPAQNKPDPNRLAKR